MYRFVISLALVTVFTALAFVVVNQPLVGIDDANIFFVYAKNLAGGHGFVYNTGGERVEGFTSLLWVLAGSVAFVWPAPEFLLLVVNVVLVAAATAAGLHFINRLLRVNPVQGRGGRLSPGEWIFLGWVLFSPGYIIWSTLALMENGLWGALLVGCTITVLNFVGRRQPGKLRRFLFWLLVALLPLTRPEGILWGAGFIAAAFVAFFLTSANLRDSLKRVAWPLAAFGLTVALLTLFRLFYFGYPLPNTYYAKVSPDFVYTASQGVDYFWRFLRSNPLLPVSVGAMVAGLWQGGQSVVARMRQSKVARQAPLSRKERLRVQHFLLSGLLSAGLIIPIIEGGDGFALFRFYQPLWPLLILPLYFLVITLRFNVFPAQKYRYVGLVALLLLFFVSNSPNWLNFQRNNRVAFEFEIAQNGRLEGQALNRIFGEGTLPPVGVVTAGGIALTYAGEIVDLMGLNHTAMAHSAGSRTGITGHAAFDKALFYQLEPKLILPRAISAGEPVSFKGYEPRSFTNLALKGLLHDERFRAAYTPAIVVWNKGQIFAFFENGFLITLQRQNHTVETVDYAAFQFENERIGE